MPHPAVRPVSAIHASRPTTEGAGVHLHRAFGFRQGVDLDPFLLLDDFRGDSPQDYIKGFPWHPHRGIETITYVLGGDVEHGDSMGNAGTIGVGDVQWMTAGSGILHQEMPQGDADGRLVGFQLWANLPARDKMMDPRYRDVAAETIPEVTTPGGARARVIAGTVGETRGPVRDIVIDPEYLDVRISPGATFEHPTPADYTCFAYVIAGAGQFGPDAHTCANRDLVVFGPGNGVHIVNSGDDELRFLLVSGKPLGEPVAWYGPIVMNTDEELETAYRELEAGTFIKTRGTGM